jgi:hypothetical protein
MTVLTLADPPPPTPLLQRLKPIHQRQNLHRGHRIMQMRIMPGRSPKTAILPLAAQHKRDGFVSRQSIGASKQVQGCEAPVKAVETQVLGEPVFELVAPRVERLDVGDVGGDGEEEVGRKGGGGAAGAELDWHSEIFSGFIYLSVVWEM